MNDRIRISDADREQVTARLREHFAQGRLSSEELDERISAALGAKTFGDLRHVMTDLPDPGLVSPQARPSAAWAPRRTVVYRRRPRFLPLALFVLVAALVIPGAGWILFAFLKLVLLFWLAAWAVGALALVFGVARFRRHVRRNWQPGAENFWRQYQWHN
jgi:hypothetical protein